ncbi:SusC/RagA family TonB-linked outer membrane protein [uncultured Sphingobacterium sp.]|uniref:SusC/RagA family TonB-linked outer membrane protein n=1 Tax=uncultured Sphingobacterium sp. TaxID=182688 RepID=UPI0025FDCA0D|nr:SusC/RagA family TonB-linked outer membrane protein [uncultured Sphingobacterium sp.]
MNRLKNLLLVTSLLAGSTVVGQQLNYQGKPTLKELFSTIRQQTGYNIIASGNQIDLNTVVKVQAKDKALRDVLDEAFKDLPFTFKIVGREITILPREKSGQQHQKQQQPAKQLLLNGTVRDKSGPVELVTVYNKSNDKVTFTNDKGAFKIERTNHTDTLVFSSVGYEERQLAVAPSQSIINMQLLQTQNLLDEVSVLSYGQEVSKRLNTGSTASVTAATIEKTPTADPLIALQNRVPGMMINTLNGLPGIQTQVQIRGINTVNQDGQARQPLYIVDGIPFNSSSLAYIGANGLTSSYLGESPFKSIDPSTIAGIEVLKDADATAIYGARGANGVILITTKRGKPGRPTISADYYHSFGSIAKYVKMLNTAQYLEMRREAAKNDGIELTPNDYPDLLKWSQTEDHDWQKEYFGNVAHTSNAELSLSGGSSGFNYLLGGGFRRENTVYQKKNGLSVGNFRSNLDYHSNDGKFKASLSASYATDKNEVIPLSFTNFQTLPPNFSLYDADGKLNWTIDNPIAALERTVENRTKNLISNIALSYELLPNLVAKINTGYTRMKMDQLAINPRRSFRPSENILGNNTFTKASTATFNFEPQLNYDLIVGRSSFRALLGGTYIHRGNSAITTSGNGYTDDSQIRDIHAAPIINIEPKDTQYRFLSGFARVGWTFDQKYVVNATVRRDGSSRFGPGKKYGNFWSVGTAWILSEESWLKDNQFGLSFAKLRGSYGLTGNDNIGDYSYFVNYERIFENYQGQGYLPKNPFNANYQWEVNKKLDLAAEMGFLKDRIIFEANYYRNRSGNQLVGYGLPTQVGFSSVNQNLDANVQNSGWEFSLQTTPINTLAFTWKTNFTMSINRNKLLSYPNLASSSNSLTYQIGKPLNLIWGYEYLGINAADGQPQFRDVNGDGFISFPDDYVPLANNIPTFFGGFGNSFNYKNFDLDIFFSFKKNTHIYNYPFTSAGSVINAPAIVLDRWQHPGEDAKFPAYTTNSSTMSNYNSSGANFVDGSYIRLSNITLSYSVPGKMLEKLKLKNLRAYVTGANLLTITSYKGTDPETGVDMPMLRTFTLGLRTSF